MFPGLHLYITRAFDKSTFKLSYHKCYTLGLADRVFFHEELRQNAT